MGILPAYAYNPVVEVKPDSVGALRAYVYDYIVGLLWILAVATMVVTEQNMLVVAHASNELAGTMSNVKVPDFVFGFWIVIGVIVLPFCVCTVIKPLSLRVMTIFHRV